MALPFKRQAIKRVPPNVPKDIRAAERSAEYDPSGSYGGMGGPRPKLLGKPGQLSQIVFPPWIFPPLYSGRYMYQSGSATLPIGPSATELAGTVFTVPINNVGVIRSLTLSVNALLATSAIRFQLLFNGGPVQGHDNLVIFPRAAASVSVSFSPEETVIPVPDGTRISMRVIVTDPVIYFVGAEWRGWFYSKDVANRYHEV